VRKQGPWIKVFPFSFFFAHPFASRVLGSKVFSVRDMLSSTLRPPVCVCVCVCVFVSMLCVCVCVWARPHTHTFQFLYYN
jgi:undecaprenyl pyrophosphate phosphatase UppP